MSTVLKVEKLVKKFGSRQIINHLSIEVNAGEVYGFLGPNGSGKTTTIKMILGLLSIDEGEISIAGFDHRKNYEKALACIGGIVENPDTYGYLSAKNNLKLYQRTHGPYDPVRIAQVLALVGLTSRADDKVKRFSLGMKQRLGLAQAIMHNPKILILDEPTNGLDPAGIRELRDILKRLAHEEGIAVLVSSHLLTEMQLMCDRVCIIDRGNVLAVRDIADMTEDHSNGAYRFHLAPADKAAAWFAGHMPDRIIAQNDEIFDVSIVKEEIPELIRQLVTDDVLIFSASAIARTLEDSFMEITGGGNDIA